MVYALSEGNAEVLAPGIKAEETGSLVKQTSYSTQSTLIFKVELNSAYITMFNKFTAALCSLVAVSVVTVGAGK